MSFNISYIFEAIDRFSPTIGKINSSLIKMQSKIKSVTSSFKKFGSSVTSLGRSLSLKLTAPLAAFGVYVLKQAANFQTLTQQIVPYVGSLAAANAYMNKLSKWAVKATPFHVKDIGAAATSLLNFHIQLKDIIPDLKRLGDISAQTRIPLDVLTRVFGRASKFGKIMLKWVYQVPQLIPAMTKVLHEAGKKGTFLDLAKQGLLTFAVLQRAIIEMTSKGGIAFKGMDRNMNTIVGSLTKLMDNIELTSKTLGNFIWKNLKLLKVVQLIISGLEDFVPIFEKFVKVHPILSKIVLFFGLILGLIGPLLIGVGLLIAGFTALGITIESAIWPITLIGIGIIAAGAALTYLYIKFKAVRLLVGGIELAIRILVSAFEIALHVVEKIAKVIGFIMKWTGMKLLLMGVGKILGAGKTLTRADPGAYARPESPFIRMFLPSLVKPTAPKTNITIHVKDPGKIINKVTQKTDGSTAVVHLGKNMKHLDVGWIGG